MVTWIRSHWKSVVSVLALLVAFFVYRSVRADPRLAEIRHKQAQLAKTSDPEEQKKLRKELGESMRGLTDSQRRALFADGRKKWEEDEKRYLTLAPTEKVKWLDERIDRMEKSKKNGPRNPGAGGGPGAGFLPPGSGGNPSSKGAAFKPKSREEQELRRKQSLDRSTPEQRARRDQITRDLAARRQERGLPPAGPKR